MNFLEAVQALKEGKCEGIKSKNYNYVLVLSEVQQKLVHYEGRKSLCMTPEYYLSDWQLVNPVKQYKEEEVVMYVNESSLGRFCSDTPVDSSSIKLTGTRKVEVKPKVKRREEVTDVELIERNDGSIIFNDIKKAQVFMEWYEDAE